MLPSIGLPERHLLLLQRELPSIRTMDGLVSTLFAPGTLEMIVPSITAIPRNPLQKGEREKVAGWNISELAMQVYSRGNHQTK